MGVARIKECGVRRVRVVRKPGMSSVSEFSCGGPGSVVLVQVARRSGWKEGGQGRLLGHRELRSGRRTNIDGDKSRLTEDLHLGEMQAQKLDLSG
jgi:hypothetical protein